MNREQGLKMRLGQRVVHKPTGVTGEIREVFPEWGVEVWVQEHNNNRERWWWDSILIRRPRQIKRYPRPFRFPRLQPTKCCHCPEGVMVPKGKKKPIVLRKAINRKLKVVSENKVRCNFCKLFIGKESFPARIRRASALLRKAEIAGAFRKRKSPKKVDRSKVRKTTYPRKKRNSKLPRRTGKDRVDLRTRGRKEKSHDAPVSSATAQPISTPPIPETQNPPVSKAEEIGSAPAPEVQKAAAAVKN